MTNKLKTHRGHFSVMDIVQINISKITLGVRHL